MNTYVNNLLKYKDLFIELVTKDITLKYRSSFLGILWSLLNPLMMMVVLSIVFMSLFDNEIQYYPLYVLTARILFQFFSESTNFAMDSIHANGHLIRKVYVPKYFFPLSKLCSSFITTMISLLTIVLMMIIYGIPFTWMKLLFIIPMIYLLGISAGIGLLLASINVFFKDMKHFYSVVIMILMYMTPIFYPASIIPDNFMPIIMLNPIYHVIEMFREIVMYGVMPHLSYFLYSLFHMLFYSVLGLFVFYKTQDRFIHYI